MKFRETFINVCPFIIFLNICCTSAISHGLSIVVQNQIRHQLSYQEAHKLVLMDGQVKWKVQYRVIYVYTVSTMMEI